MNKNDIKKVLHTTVWFQENWTNRIVYGLLEAMDNDYVRIYGNSKDDKYSFKGSCWVHFKEIYKTKDDCIKAIKAKNDAIVEVYKAEIIDLYSLINFPLKYNVGQCEEYTDYNATRAYKERAAELGFDIDLECDTERY